MKEQSNLDQAIAHGQRMEDAGNDGWPCGEMLFYAFLCFLVFVVLPAMLPAMMGK